MEKNLCVPHTLFAETINILHKKTLPVWDKWGSSNTLSANYFPKFSGIVYLSVIYSYWFVVRRFTNELGGQCSDAKKGPGFKKIQIPCSDDKWLAASQSLFISTWLKIIFLLSGSRFIVGKLYLPLPHNKCRSVTSKNFFPTPCLLALVSKYISGAYKGFWFKFMGPEHMLPSLGKMRGKYQKVEFVRNLRMWSWKLMK